MPVVIPQHRRGMETVDPRVLHADFIYLSTGLYCISRGIFIHSLYLSSGPRFLLTADNKNYSIIYTPSPDTIQLRNQKNFGIHVMKKLYSRTHSTQHIHVDAFDTLFPRSITYSCLHRYVASYKLHARQQ